MSSAPSTLDGPSLPRTAGGFRLVRQLGRGGMGVVYEAEELSSGRTVALKVLLHELGVEGQAFERFQREARLAAAISHNHCVFVYGAHQVDGFPAIAMELVGGETIEDKIRRNERVPVEAAVRWTLDILDGLEAAHSAGILHRDVKPSNCFVTPEGRVKIGDFGLSRSLDSDVQLTQSGQFLGSPLYASPEQIRGRAVDVRSDLYSCSATLYAVLSGKAPYGGSNVGEVLARILSEPPPPLRSVRPEIPRGLERVVLRAMDRDPDKRFRDLASFRAALAPFAAGSGAPAKRGRRVAAHLVDIVLVAFVSSAFVSLALSTDLPAAKLDATKPWIMGSPAFNVFQGLLPLVYYSLTEGLLGSSLGKWLFGQRVVAVATGQPSLRRATLRAFVFVFPSILLITFARFAASTQVEYSLLALGSWLLNVALLLSPMRLANGWRGLHELASGTRTVQVPSPFSRARISTPPVETAVAPSPSGPERIGDYRVEGTVGRTLRGTMLQAQDETLGRRVWIHVLEGDGTIADEARRALARPARLRWLGAARMDGRSCDVLEAPGGSSLPDLAARGVRLEWPVALRLLTALVDEIAADRSAGARFALEQVWIDRHWNLRLLDEPVGPGAFSPREPITFASEAARAMLLGDPAAAPRVPSDLPTYAEPLVRRLVGLDEPLHSLSELRDGLASFQGRPDALSRKTRGAQLAVNAIIPALLAGFAMVGAYAMQSVVEAAMGTRLALRELHADAATPAPEDRNEKPSPLTEDGRRAREMIVVHLFRSPLGPQIEKQMESEFHDTIKAAEEHQAQPSDAELAWAEGVLQAEHGAVGKLRETRADTLSGAVPTVALYAILAWGVLASAFALALRGGLSLSLFGIHVRDGRGQRASRLRCLGRVLLAWVPMCAAFAAVFALTTRGQTSAAVALAMLAGGLQAAAVAHAILHPARSLADSVARTRLVPR